MTTGGFDPSTRPDWVRAVNRGDIEPINDEANRPLDRDGLLAEAIALDGTDGGIEAFGDESFLEPLDVFTRAVEHEARLHTLGRWMTRRFLLRLLVGRLQIERYIARDPGVLDEEIVSPVFVAGAPRSGTTILHALLVRDDALRAPLGWELLRPVPPPVVAPDGRRRGGDGGSASAHGARGARGPLVEDGRVALAEAELRMLARVSPSMDAIHEYGSRNPKECLSAMSFEFCSEEFTARYHVPSYVEWFRRCDMGPAYAWHRRVLQILQRRTHGRRWVLKSPTHLHFLADVLRTYPDARVAITHRDPLVVLASVSSLIANLRFVHSDHVDMADVGRFHAELFVPTFQRLTEMDRAGSLPVDQVAHGQYADFIERPIDTVAALCERLGVHLGAATLERMRAHLDARPKGRHGEHRYDFDDLGLDRAATCASLAGYVEHFGVPVAW